MCAIMVTSLTWHTWSWKRQNHLIVISFSYVNNMHYIKLVPSILCQIIIRIDYIFTYIDLVNNICPTWHCIITINVDNTGMPWQFMVFIKSTINTEANSCIMKCPPNLITLVYKNGIGHMPLHCYNKLEVVWLSCINYITNKNYNSYLMCGAVFISEWTHIIPISPQ